MPKLKGASEKINGWNIKHKDNAPEAARAKVTIRSNVLEAIGAEQAAVFDAYAGTGMMWLNVWRDAAAYVGCEKEQWAAINLREQAPHGGLALVDPRWPERDVYFGDNERVMRCLNLHHFNVFDFDAYGSPWAPVYLMMERRKVAPGERIGLVLTEGQGMKMCQGGMSGALSLVAGVTQYMPGMGSAQQGIIDRAVRRVASHMNCTIDKHWQAVSRNSSTIRYIGVVMTGNAAS